MTNTTDIIAVLPTYICGNRKLDIRGQRLIEDWVWGTPVSPLLIDRPMGSQDMRRAPDHDHKMEMKLMGWQLFPEASKWKNFRVYRFPWQ